MQECVFIPIAELVKTPFSLKKRRNAHYYNSNLILRTVSRRVEEVIPLDHIFSDIILILYIVLVFNPEKLRE